MHSLASFGYSIMDMFFKTKLIINGDTKVFCSLTKFNINTIYFQNRVPVKTAASLTAIGGIICRCFIDKNQRYHISLGRYDLIIWLRGWLVQLQFIVCICTIIQICLNFRKSQIIRDLPGVAQLLERLWACGQVCRCSYLCKLGERGHIWQRFSDASCPIQRSQRESKSHHKRHTWTRQWVRIQNHHAL